jgi:hypothetical protein
MEPFMTFFEQMPAWERLAWVVTCLLLSWLLEAGMPLFRLQYRKWRHAMVNLALLGLVVIINLVMGLLVVWSLHQGQDAGFGLFFWVDWSPWVQLIASAQAFSKCSVSAWRWSRKSPSQVLYHCSG